MSDEKAVDFTDKFVSAKEAKAVEGLPTVEQLPHVANLTPVKEQEPFRDHRDLLDDVLVAAREYQKSVDEEYGKYRANQDILTPHGVVAYLKGQPVPISNVKLHKYDDLGYVDEVKK